MTSEDKLTRQAKALREVEREGWQFFQRTYRKALRKGTPDEEALRLASEASQVFVKEHLEVRLKDMVIEDFIQHMIVGKDLPE